MNARNDLTRRAPEGGRPALVSVTVDNERGVSIYIRGDLVKWWRVLMILTLVAVFAVFLGGGPEAWKGLILRALNKPSP
jgi:hypothetical protein